MCERLLGRAVDSKGVQCVLGRVKCCSKNTVVLQSLGGKGLSDLASGYRLCVKNKPA